MKTQDADTEKQISIASLSSLISLFGGLLVSVIFFSMQSKLMEGQLDAAALSSLGVGGTVLIVFGVCYSFAAFHFYSDNSAGSRKASHDAKMRALNSNASHIINEESTTAHLTNTVGQIMQQLPSHARRQGATDASRYMDTRFDPEEVAEPVPLSRPEHNGQNP